MKALILRSEKESYWGSDQWNRLGGGTTGVFLKFTVPDVPPSRCADEEITFVFVAPFSVLP